MRSFRQWLVEDLGYSLIPSDIPKTNTGLIGNGDGKVSTSGLNASDQLSFSTTAGISSNKPDGQKLKTKITELPVPRHDKQQKGLGDLGMEIIGKTTFGKNESRTACRRIQNDL